MSWMITYQSYCYSEPQGKPRSVEIEEHPTDFIKKMNERDEYGNYTYALLFAIEREENAET